MANKRGRSRGRGRSAPNKKRGNPHALRGASSEKGSRKWYVGGFQA